MISLDGLIEQWGEGIVRVVGSGVDTGSRVCPLDSRAGNLLERETVFVSSVFAFLPDIRGYRTFFRFCPLAVGLPVGSGSFTVLKV